MRCAVDRRAARGAGRGGVMIPFTEYRLPNGAQHNTGVECSADVEELAQHCITRGVRFEVEILTTGEVSLAAEGDDDTYAMEVVPNGPGVREAVERLVRATHSMVQP